MPAPADWFTIEARVPSADSPKKGARVKLHGVIGGGFFENGVTASQFMRELEMMGEVAEIDLEVDSPGGSVSVGWAIYNALEQHPARIVATVIGTAASMASVIILAADEIRIPENGSIMIPRAQGGARGTHEEVARASEIIKQFEDGIVAAYVKRTKQPEKSIRAMMATLVGTWFFGKDAVAKGFADKVLPGVKAAAFNGEWKDCFEFIPTALIDTLTNPNPQQSENNIADMKPEDIVALVIKTIGEQTAATNKTHTDAITAIRDGIGAAVTTALTPALETALKPVNEKLGTLETAVKPIADLTNRLEKAEGVIKSGVLNHAGGGKGLEGAGGEGGGESDPAAPTNEKELREALAKVNTHAEKSALIEAFDARNQKK